jgi:hypothetical protein
MASFRTNVTDDVFLACPYDSNHRLAHRRYRAHVATCPSRLRRTDLLVCPINSLHIIKVSEREKHMATCILAEDTRKLSETSSAQVSSSGQYRAIPRFSDPTTGTQGMSTIGLINNKAAKSLSIDDDDGDGWGNNSDGVSINRSRRNGKAAQRRTAFSDWRTCSFRSDGTLIRPLDCSAIQALSRSEREEYNEMLNNAARIQRENLGSQKDQREVFPIDESDLEWMS